MPTNNHKNIQLDSTDKNFTFDGIYFYSYNNTTNSIVQKTDDGNIAFTYPVAIPMTQEVKSIHYEGLDRPNSLNGMCFWTLETKAGNDGIIIRRIVMDNFVGKQSGVNVDVVDVSPHTITLSNNSSVNWTSIESMAVECYETKVLDIVEYPGNTLSGSAVNANGAGDFVLRLYDDLTDNTYGTKQFKGTAYEDSPSLRSTTEPGMNKSQQELLEKFLYDNDDEIIDSSVRMVVGPDADGFFETVFVQSAPTHYTATYSGNPLRFVDVPLSSGLQRSYPEGTPVRFYKNIFLFSSYNSGILYLINDSGNIVKSVTSAEYAGVSGAVFSQRERRVIYSKQSNASFLEPDKDNTKLVKTMTLDNIGVDSITVIPIYDLCTSYSGTLFRLQQSQVYNNTLETFGTNNYVITPLFPLVKSISIRPVPQIIAADNIAATTITATVRDQFNNPIEGIFVNLTEDDSTGGSGGQGGYFYYLSQQYNGSITNVLQTDINGQVKVQYIAGDNNTDVTITASVKQLVS